MTVTITQISKLRSERTTATFLLDLPRLTLPPGFAMISILNTIKKMPIKESQLCVFIWFIR